MSEQMYAYPEGDCDVPGSASPQFHEASRLLRLRRSSVLYGQPAGCGRFLRFLLDL